VWIQHAKVIDMETELHAFVEHLAGLVRVGPHARAYGMDWDFIVAYASVDGKTAVIKGLKTLTAGFTMAHATAILRALARAGFLYATWTRHKAGKVREVRVDLVGMAD
jgi:hypothetical protein